MNNDNKIKSIHTFSQEDLEVQARKELAAREALNVKDFAKRGYFSGTGLGRKALTTNFAHEDSDATSNLETLADHVKRGFIRVIQNPKLAAYPLMVDIWGYIQEAIDFKTPDGKKYAPDGVTDPSSIVAVIILKSALDGAMSLTKENNNAGKGANIGYVFNGILAALERQTADAYYFVRAYKVHQKTTARHTQFAQGKEFVTNGVKKAQKYLGRKGLEPGINPHTGEPYAGWEPWTTWEDKTKIEVAAELTAALMSALPNLFVKVEGRPQRGHKNGATLIAIHPDAEEMFAEVLENSINDRMLGWPMVEPPKPWKYEKDLPGHLNTSGGYYLPSSREFWPLIRTDDGCPSQTSPSKKAIEFLNTVQSTAFRLHDTVLENFAWVIKNRIQGIDDVNPGPSPSHWQLKNDEEFAKWPLDKEHLSDDWRFHRTALFNKAAEQEKRANKAKRSYRYMLFCQRFEKMWWPWSYDSRQRAYPIGGLLNPHSPSYERACIKFDKGVQVDVKNADQMHDIYQAIGTAALGGQTSINSRIKWATANIDKLVEELDYNAETYIQRLCVEGYKEPWALLGLVAEYRDCVKGDELWRVPLFIDQSQSGLAFLSGLTRDKKGLTATSCLNASDPSKPPVDAYLLVAAHAVKLSSLLAKIKLEDITKAGRKNKKFKVIPCDEFTALLEMGCDKKWILQHAQKPSEWMERIAEILDPESSSASRSVSKSPVMTLLYGSSIRRRNAKVADVLDDKKIAITSTIYADRDGKYEENAQFLLSAILELATRQTFPIALKALDWIRQVASMAVLTDEARLGGLTYKLSDGTLVNLKVGQKNTDRYRTLEFGRPTVALGWKEEQNLTKLIGSSSPNIVHSLDALCLRLGVDDWEEPVLCIHDCVGVLPGSVGKMRDRLQAAFIKAVEKNPLIGLAADHLGINFPALPMLQTGDAVLSELKGSQYMYQ